MLVRVHPSPQHRVAGCVLGMLFLLVCFCCPVACRSAATGSSGRTGLDWGNAPPARPGSSITHTSMCECYACADAACCKGADESQAECDVEAVSESSDDGEATIDFSKDESCGVEVRACTRQCTKKVWRVSARQDCSTGRPAQCCT